MARPPTVPRTSGRRCKVRRAATAELPYAVLALGDSSYEQFCGFGRKLDQRLAELGGRRLQRVDCEPDFDEVFAGWLEALLPSLGAPPRHTGRSG